MNENIKLQSSILELSRQEQTAKLSPWFTTKLFQFIEERLFHPEYRIHQMKTDIVGQLARYKRDHNIENVVLGMSGGLDSALTASLFKEAGWNVTGVLMPIYQEPSETERGHDVCQALGIPDIKLDLSNEFDVVVKTFKGIDDEIDHNSCKNAAIRRGNIRARLRMTTLYNLASMKGGLVASTDNFSELSAGFWTLHGDEGDVAPIQSLLKSWEVPSMAKISGVPDHVIMAKPTDGLGIDDGDEAQFGCTYLEWDIMTLAMLKGDTDVTDRRAADVFDLVSERIKKSGFKRSNPTNLITRVEPYRLTELDKLDERI